MQETHQSSFRKQVTVEQLLQLKRLEKPHPDFWDEFDHELKQKQLQALMRPSRWEKLRSAVQASKLPLLAPLSFAAILCMVAGLVVFPLFTDNGGQFEIALVEAAPLTQAVEPMVAEPVTESAAAEVAEVEPIAPLRTDRRFVEDVLRPEAERFNGEPFRTVAETETFVGASDSSAYYVVNAFTAAPGRLSGRNVTFEF